MSHRLIDQHKIHNATTVLPDEKVDATEHAFRSIAKGDYRGAPSREVDAFATLPSAEVLEAPREDTTGAFERRGVGSGAVQIGPTVPAPPPRVEHDPRDRWEHEDAAKVQRLLRRSLLIPGALLLACTEHEAEVGKPCWGRIAGTPGSGVCMSRVLRGKVASAPGPVSEMSEREASRRQDERERTSQRLRVRATDRGTEPWERGSRMTSWQ